MGQETAQWVQTGTGHTIAILDDRIVVRNAKGRQLATVPPAVRKSEAYEELDGTLAFLAQHERAAGDTVERWLLRSLPIPAAVLTEVWADVAWRSWLTDLVIATPDGVVSGFLRDVSDEGQHIVDLDGETVTLTADAIVIPHPAVLADLDDLRDFAVELGITQRLDQLFREVFVQPDSPRPLSVTSLHDWEDGAFPELRFALSRARSGGFIVSGGFATTVAYDGDRRTTARYWVGSGYPEEEAVTGELFWEVADAVQPVAEVGSVAYSEGVRMAAHIYAGRTIAEENDES